MRNILAVILSLIALPAHAGMSLDANGWTVITPSSTGYCEGISCTPRGGAKGTRIIYVANSGCDFGVAGCRNDGSFSRPQKTAAFAISKMRGGSPDWVLFKCGDTWTNDPPSLAELIPGANASGVDSQNPMVVSNYDPGATHAPPVPDPASCSQRPQFNVDHTTNHYCIHGISNVAVLGIKCYAPGRDPNNSTISPTFNTTDRDYGQPGFFFGSNSGIVGDILLEDVWMGYLGGGIAMSTASYPPWADSLKIRRNEVVGIYHPEGTGVLWGKISNSSTIAQNVMYQNIFDHNGWGPNKPPSGFTHNLYLPNWGPNGDNASQSTTGVTFDGNILTNEGAAPALRSSGIYTNNLLMHNPRGMPIQFPQSSPNPSTITNNVILDGATTPAVGGADGIEIISRYIDQPSAETGANITGNIVANGPGAPDATGIIFYPANGPAGSPSGANGNTVSGNYVYNWGWHTPSNAIVGVTTGAVCNGTISAGGSGYTDLSIPITSSASSSSVAPHDGQNYVVVAVPSIPAIFANPGAVYINSGGLNGVYQASIASSTSIVIFGTRFSSSFTGTLYYPYYQAALTHVSGSGTGLTLDLISAGNTIVGYYLYGSDKNQGGLEAQNSPGSGFKVNDTATSTVGGGTGMVFTVSQLCNNTLGTNYLDAVGSNMAGWPDPNRTPGSYYATLPGSTPNATLTASIDAGGVMHVTSITGTLDVGDAITFAGQTKADFIKGNSRIGNSLCNVAPTSATCTGSGSTGTYALAGTKSVSSASMSSYNTQQLIALMDNQSKATWNTALTAPVVNAYIQQGFGGLPRSLPK